MRVDVLNRDVAVVEIFLIHDAAMQRNQVLNTGDHRLIKSRFHATHSVFSVVAPNEEFRKKRIETPGHFVPRMGVRIAADAKAAREMTLP